VLSNADKGNVRQSNLNLFRGSTKPLLFYNWSYTFMNGNQSTSSVSRLELLQSGNVLIDESELKINNQNVTRRQFLAMDKKVVFIRPNPED
jgi:hypothetical protein